MPHPNRAGPSIPKKFVTLTYAQFDSLTYRNDIWYGNVGSSMFLGLLQSCGAQAPENFWDLCVHQTRCETNFYAVDHEC